MRTLTIALAACLIVLPGCLEGSEPVSPGEHQAPGGAAVPLPDPGNGTDAPSTGSEVGNGTRWLLEQWAEESELPILGTVVELHRVGWGDSSCLGCNRPLLRPAGGVLVPPGTERVEVTADFTPPPTASAARVLVTYRTASDAEPQQLSLGPGEVREIPVTPADWDAPFQKQSSWWFSLLLTSEPAILAPGTSPVEVEVRAVAKRAAKLPEIPEPADPWKGGSTLVIQPAQAHQIQQAGAMGDSICLGCPTRWEPPAGAIVPPGAATLQATLSWTYPGPTKPVLWAWHGTEENARALPLVTDGDASRAYEVEVPAEAADSPYQTRTSWGFFVTFETGGMEDTEAVFGDVTLEAVVLRGRGVE